MFSDIRLQRFRSYRDETFEFEPGVNIIVGPNASGKTNMLEALLVSCVGSSYRAKDVELVAHGAPWTRIDAHTGDGLRTVKLMVQDGGPVKKEYEIQSQKYLRLSLQKSVPVVLFEPNHLMLLHGSPDIRRDYMDGLLEQTVPGYSKTRRDYRRILTQRNSLLKRGASSKSQLFAWNIRLSEVGGIVASERHNLILRLNEKLGDLYGDLSGDKQANISVSYASAIQDISQYTSALLQALEKRQDIDMERGYTTVGPHRDDMQVYFDGRDASEVASRGETRTVLLALKILELELLEQSRGVKPVLLLDDVFSELDGRRRKALTEVIKGYQTFITTTDADVVVQHFIQKCNIIPL